jgi:hypothetical protein
MAIYKPEREHLELYTNSELELEIAALNAIRDAVENLKFSHHGVTNYHWSDDRCYTPSSQLRVEISGYAPVAESCIWHIQQVLDKRREMAK